MSLIDALLAQQPQKQATPSTGLGLLLGEAQKTAGMLTGGLGGALGIDTRPKREQEVDAVKKLIAQAPGDNPADKLKAALPQVMEINPVLGLALQEQIRTMSVKPKSGSVVNIPFGEPVLNPLTQKMEQQKKPAWVDNDGNFVRWVQPNEQAPAPKTGGGGGTLSNENAIIKVGAGQFVPKGAVDQAQKIATRPDGTNPVPPRPQLKAEDISDRRAEAVRPNVARVREGTPVKEIRRRIAELNKKGMLTPAERQELFTLQSELDKRK